MVHHHINPYLIILNEAKELSASFKKQLNQARPVVTKKSTNLLKKVHICPDASRCSEACRQEDQLEDTLAENLEEQLQHVDTKMDDINAAFQKNANPVQQQITQALVRSTQDIVNDLTRNVTTALQQTIESEKDDEDEKSLPTEPVSRFRRCIRWVTKNVKATASAAFRVFYYLISRVFRFLFFIITSPLFVWFLWSAWTIIHRHFCAFLAMKLGYDIKTQLQEIPPQKLFDTILSPIIMEFFGSSYFANIFDTIATGMTTLLNSIVGGILTTTGAIIYDTLSAVSSTFASAANFVGSVSSYLVNLMTSSLKTAMQLAFPAVIASFANTRFFDLIITGYFTMQCIGKVYQFRVKPKNVKKSTKPPGRSGAANDKDDDDDNNGDDGDLKAGNPMAAEAHFEQNPTRETSDEPELEQGVPTQSFSSSNWTPSTALTTTTDNTDDESPARLAAVEAQLADTGPPSLLQQIAESFSSLWIVPWHISQVAALRNMVRHPRHHHHHHYNY